MDFAFTPEQEELRREARAFLAANPEPSWAELAELGWTGVSVAEAEGGAGLGFLEEAVLAEELGRALVPGPWFATVALALPALGPEARARVAAGEEAWSAEVDGLVPDLHLVDRVVTARGAVAAEGETLATTDGTRPLGRLRDGLDAEPLPGALARPRALAACALEAVGIAQRALELAVAHVREREQFGRPVGAFQAVAHPLADTFVETELARSLAYWAAWCVAEGDDRAPVAAAAAKAHATETALAACERSLQAHGGIGFTWEHPLHRYYKRSHWLHGFLGFPAALRSEVAAAVIDGIETEERDGVPARVA